MARRLSANRAGRALACVAALATAMVAAGCSRGDGEGAWPERDECVAERERMMRGPGPIFTMMIICPGDDGWIDLENIVVLDVPEEVIPIPLDREELQLFPEEMRPG